MKRERERAGLIPAHSMNVRVLCDACVDLQVAPCTELREADEDEGSSAFTVYRMRCFTKDDRAWDV
eukprot:COSAG03_NODE_17362_length_377_cov_0.881295_1_plen_65_part_10